MLKLNGKPLDVHSLPEMVKRAIAIAKKLPNDELLDAAEMAKKLGVSPHSLKAHVQEEMQRHRAVLQISTRRIVVFGNAATIAGLKKSMERA